MVVFKFKVCLSLKSLKHLKHQASATTNRQATNKTTQKMPKDVAIYIVVVFKIIGQKPNKPQKLKATFLW